MKYLYCLICAVLAASILVAPAGAQNKTRVKSINVPSVNGEICLGDTLRPRITVSNVSTSVQNIRAQITITNAVTGINVYAAIVDLQNIPAGKDTVVAFGAFATNPNMLSQLGRHNVTAIGSVVVAGVVTPDSNPADDTLRTLLFGLRRTASPFEDASNNYSVIGALAIPDQQRWVSVGATVVEGDAATFDPPSPRDPAIGYGPLKLHSPVIKLDRRNIAGAMYSGNNVGDTLSSFPINLQNVSTRRISFDYHRSGKRLYGWKYDKDTLYGCESTVLDNLGNLARAGDSLVIEFKKPAEPGCEPSSNGWTEVAAIDGGKDLEFHHYSFELQSKNNSSTNYSTADFRLRFRLKAKPDQTMWSGSTPVDDDDAWYIDNFQMERNAHSEIRVNWVRVVNPYTKVPASQANFPVNIKLSNDGPGWSPDLPLLVQIIGPDGKTKYYQKKFVAIPAIGKDTVVQFPFWDASNTTVSAGRECIVHAWIDYDGYDSHDDDNYAYSKCYLNVDNSSDPNQEFAYDDAGISPGLNTGNDFPLLFSHQGAGAGFSNTSGSYAMRFKLTRKDTLYGARIYFGAANAGDDAIRISVLDGSPQSATPGAVVSADATMQTERKGNQFDQFWTYYFPKPIALKGELDGGDGIYWLSVSQLGLDKMQLGADISRTGGDHRLADSFTPVILNVHSSPYATQYDADHNAGDISRAFALEVVAGSGNWSAFNTRNNWYDVVFIPMIRPLVSKRTLLRVEFAKPLMASAKANAALLTWTTATESNNSGFVVQRLAGTEDWQRIGFVASRASNSSSPNGYAFIDEGLSAGTYTYRLTQVDLDGTESISNIAEVSIAEVGARISNFTPNPFNPSTGVACLSIDPSLGAVSVAIVNALGQTIRTMKVTSIMAWDGKDDAGNAVASGSYLVRLEGMGTRRITIVR